MTTGRVYDIEGIGICLAGADNGSDDITDDNCDGSGSGDSGCGGGSASGL